jgi:hypothetical protein
MRFVLMFEGASTDKEEVAGISHSPHTYAVHPNGTNLRAGNGGSAMALLLGKRQNTRNIPIMVELRHLIADSQLRAANDTARFVTSPSGIWSQKFRKNGDLSQL